MFSFTVFRETRQNGGRIRGSCAENVYWAKSIYYWGYRIFGKSFNRKIVKVNQKVTIKIFIITTT